MATSRQLTKLSDPGECGTYIRSPLSRMTLAEGHFQGESHGKPRNLGANIDFWTPSLVIEYTWAAICLKTTTYQPPVHI